MKVTGEKKDNSTGPISKSNFLSWICRIDGFKHESLILWMFEIKRYHKIKFP